MQNLEFTCTSTLELGTHAVNHYYQLRILPHDDPAQRVTIDECTVTPAEHLVQQRDGWGNTLLVGSALQPHDSFGYSVRGHAHVDSRQGRGTICSPIFRHHSPLTHPGPLVRALHASAGTFEKHGQPAAVFERAVQLAALVHNTLEYVPGVTNVKTSAEETLEHGRGVCQDFSHVLLALLRADGIPSRYVCGLMRGEGATHAWVEFYDGGTWWGLDPTNACEAGDFYIALARGRDFSNCPMEQGIFFGGTQQLQLTHVNVQVAGQQSQQQQ